MTNGSNRMHRINLLLLALVLTVVGLAQAWFGGFLPGGTDLSDSHLTALYCRALAHGQAHLLEAPDPRVLSAADPFQSEAKQYLIYDASLYRGRYYMYFGIVPFVLVLVPWYWITGTVASPAAVIILFNLVGLAAQGLLILRIADQLTPACKGGLPLALGTIALSGGTWVLLGRPAIYEIENAAAQALLSISLFCVSEALRRSTTTLSWRAAAGGFAALTLGCRPNYFPAVAIICAWAITGILFESDHPMRDRLRRASWILVPAVTVISLLALWNWLRFDRPTEFGLTYTVSQDPAIRRPLMHPENVPYSLHRYLVGGARLGAYFPFVHGPHEPELSRGATQEVSNQVYGLVWTYPLIVLGIAALPIAFRSTSRPLRRFMLLLAGSAAGNLAFLTLIPMSSYRYPADFLGPLAILAGLGWLCAAARAQGITLLLGGLIGTVGSLAAATLVTCVTFSIAERHVDFSTRRPAAFAAVARVFNHFAFWWEECIGAGPTSWRLNVRFAPAPPGRNEPLIVWGEPGAQNFLFAHRINDTAAQLGLEPMGRGGLRSAPCALDLTQAWEIELHVGRELPPAGHPLLAPLSAAHLAQVRRLVSVKVNGRVVFDEVCDLHPAKGLFAVGKSPDDDAFGRSFGGVIVAERIPINPSISPWRWNAESYGPVHLETTFVPLPAGVMDPLLSLGRPGRGEQLLAQHDGAGGIILLWTNSAGRTLPVGSFRFSPDRPVHLLVEAGALLPDEANPLWPETVSTAERRSRRNKLVVTIDNHLRFEGSWEAADLSPAMCVVGEDTILSRGGVMPRMLGRAVLLRREPWR